MKQNYCLGLSIEGFHRIGYSEWGKASSGVPIICVHGLSRNRHDFDVLADFLSRREKHVFCPDVVGRGDSDWLSNPEHYTFEQYISDMNALVARTLYPKVDWVGTSMGGVIGMIMASMPQSPIRKLVLNDIGPHIPGRALSKFTAYVGTNPLFDSIEDAEKYIKTRYASFGHLTEQQWQAITKFSIHQNSTGHYLLKMDPDIKVFSNQMKWILKLAHPIKTLKGTEMDINLWEVWHKIKCPVLLIRGQFSEILLPSTVEKMQQSHAHMEVIEVPNTGHAPLLANLTQLQTIEAWLNK